MNHLALDDSAIPVLRQISVRVVIDALLQQGPKSRAELAKITGLSKQTMSEVIRALEERGWVRVKGVSAGRIGRAAVTYEVHEEAGAVIGADLGATTLRVAVAGIAGAILGEIEEPVGPSGEHGMIGQLESAVERLLQQVGIARPRVLGATVATPGVVDPATGTLSLAPNVAPLVGLDLRDALGSALGCPVVVENDVNCAALGESWRGNGAGADSLAFVSLGTGIGLGMLLDGQLLRGARGAAGEVSYLPFGADPFAPLSLDRGALECALGADGIRLRHQMAGGPAGATVRDILALATAGDRIASITVQETARTAALLIVAVEAMFDPARIVLGGNIGSSPEVAALIREALTLCSRRPIEIEISALGRRATLMGTLAIGLNRLHNALFSPNDLPGRLRLPGFLGG